MFSLLFVKLHSDSYRNNFQCENTSSELFLQAEGFWTLLFYLIEENIEEVRKLCGLYCHLNQLP